MSGNTWISAVPTLFEETTPYVVAYRGRTSAEAPPAHVLRGERAGFRETRLGFVGEDRVGV